MKDSSEIEKNKFVLMRYTKVYIT